MSETTSETTTTEAPAPTAPGTEDGGDDARAADVRLAEEEARAPVTVAERAAFRAERRRAREAVAKERAAVTQEREAIAERARRVAAVEAAAAAAADDPVAALRALGVDPREAARALARAAAGEDPRVRALEERLAAKEAAEAAAAAAAAERAATEQRAQAQQAYRAHLAEELGALTGDGSPPADVAREPWFVERVFALQEAAWDGTETISTAEAARQVDSTLRSLYTRLASVYGAPTPTPSEAASAAGSRSASAPRHISQQRATEATPPRGKPQSESEWRAKFAKLLEEAED